MVVCNDAKLFQNLRKRQSVRLRLGNPPILSATTKGRRVPGIHPEPLVLAVPPPPLPGRAVKLQQSLENLLPCAGQCHLPALGRRPRSLEGFGVPRASLLP